MGRQHSWYHGSKPDIFRFSFLLFFFSSVLLFFCSSVLLHLLLSSQRSFAPTVWLSGLQRLSVCQVWLDWRGLEGVGGWG